VPLRVELAGDVVEQQEGRPALRAAEVLDLADLERQHHRPRLPLARVQPRGPFAERYAQIIRVWTDAGVPALAIAGQAPAKRFEKARLQRSPAAGQIVRVAARPEVGHDQGRLAARDLREGALRAWPDFLEDLFASCPQPGPQPGERSVAA